MKLREAACYVVPAVLGVVLVVIGSVIYTRVFPDIVIKKIDETLVLKNNSEAFTRFEFPDNPIYMKFYFFNVSNKDEVNKNGEKPVLKEVGPYVYRKDIIRNVSGWDNEESTIRYKEVPTYYFEPEMSSGTRQDKINHLNFVSVGMVKSTKLDLLEMLTKTKKSEMIENASGQLVETHQVDDLLFQGINITEYMPPYNDSKLSLSTVCSFVDDCKYAFFLKKNETESKLFEVKTGEPPGNSSETLKESMEHYREIVKYNELSELTNWYGPSCNALNGTDGTQFPPGVDREKGLYIFSTDVCRSLYVVYEKNEAVEGIGGLRYVMSPEGFKSPVENPDNWCFVPNDTPKELLSLGGALPVSSCYNDYPVIASSPHFYMADQRYREDFEGLKPEKSLHESFLDVEPMTGITISAAKRLQISMRIDPDPRPKFLKFINKTIAFPIFWAEEAGKVDKKHVSLLNGQLFTPYKAGKWTLVAVMALGSLMLVVTLLVFIKNYIIKENDLAHQDVSRVGSSNGTCKLNNFHRAMENSQIPTLGMSIKETPKYDSVGNDN